MSDGSTGTLFIPDVDGPATYPRQPSGRIHARFPSGRPWIVSTSPVSVAFASFRGRSAALVGDHTVLNSDVERALVKGTESALAQLHSQSDGSSILAVSDDNEVWYRPPAFGSRRLFYTVTETGVVCSDHSFLLIPQLRNPRIDTSALAAHLVEPVPHRLTERPLLSGIESVPVFSEIRIRRAGVRVHQWWSPPDQDLSLADGAIMVRERLRSAVRARVEGSAVVSSDLSGGYDSSAVCVLAAERGPVRGVTAPSRDDASEDLLWARTISAGVPNIEHLVLDPDDLPRTYAGLSLGTHASPDTPSIAVTGRARLLAVASRARSAGSRVHLAGHGGDHVMSGLPTYFHDSILKEPGRSYARLHDFALLCGWSRRSLSRALLDRRSYSRWWADQGLHSAHEIEARDPMLGWSLPLMAPGWASDLARDVISTQVRELAAEQPWGGRGLHADIESILEGTRTARAIRQIGESADIPIVSPFTDDRVIEAALSTQPAERVSANEYKPLLRQAMQGIVPAAALTRHTKDDGSVDVVTGLGAHRDELRALWENSALAELGLIDGSQLAKLCDTPSAPELQNGAMYSTIGCELWARSALDAITERTAAHA